MANEERLLRQLWARLDDARQVAEIEMGRVSIALPSQGLDPAVKRVRDAAAAFVTEIRKVTAELGIATPEWAERREIEHLLDEIDAQLDAAASRPRAFLCALAAVLRGGDVRTRQKAKQDRLLTLKEGAEAELDQAARASSPPSVDGPKDASEWLGWALHLEDPELSGMLESLRSHLAKLADFLSEMEPSFWVGGRETALPELPPARPPQLSAPAAQGTDNAATARPVAVVADSLAPIPDPGPEESNGAASVPMPQSAAGLAALGTVREKAPPPAAAGGSAEPARTPEANLRTAAVRLPTAMVDKAVATRPVSEYPTINPNSTSYAAYADNHVARPDGTVTPAPWRVPQFQQQLDVAAADALRRTRFDHLWLFARAAEELTLSPLVPTGDVQIIAGLWSTPRAPQAGRSATRAAEIRNATSLVAVSATPKWRLRAFAEALRPSQDDYLLQAEVDDLLSLVEIESPALRDLVRGLLTLRSYGSLDPMRQLLDALNAKAKPSVTQLEEALQLHRTHIHREVTRLWSIGGAVQRTHCREAWSAFIEEMAPTLRVLYPVDKGGKSDWDVSTMRRAIAAIPARHDAIADARHALRDDRRKMDRAAALIATLATNVNETLGDLLSARAPHDSYLDEQLPLAAARDLMAAARLPAADEELCRQILRRAVADEHDDEDPLDLTSRDLCLRPDLLACFPGLELSNLADRTSFDRRVVRATAVTSAARASAILLEPSTVAIDEAEAPIATVRRSLQSRPLLLSLVSAALPPTEQARVHRECAAEQERAVAAIDGLRRKSVELDAAAAALPAAALREIIESATRIVERGMAGESAMVVRAWLRDVAQWAERVVGVVREHSPDAFASSGTLRVRETAWRRSALEANPEPLGSLRSQEDKISRELVDAWSGGITGDVHTAQRRLRTLFAQTVFSGNGAELFQQGDSRPNEFRIACSKLRLWLSSQQLNPSYVPQLARYGDLVVLTPPVGARTAGFVQKAAETVASRKGDLCVVLTPQLTAPTRDAVLREFRRRNLGAAVIDDIDLVRLLNPGGPRPNLVLGLCEIALEQQEWLAMSPFAAHEGSQVRMELYVGRRREAGELSTSPRYSRLFSGRKLGKSALLRFIEENDDGMRLPSRLKLRVLYVPIVGAESEDDVVERIIRATGERLQYKAAAALPDKPGDRLVAFFRGFVERRSDESVLIVLDEADRFVEGQLEEYERRREECLAFRMRSDVEAVRDAMGLPRVRFVFAGYRVTHTFEGPWNNWGDVLRLAPLSNDDAAQLVAGSLARLGIDATDQAASIAFRCGCQPAVVLRFGQALLTHLDRKHPASVRDSVTVTADDVSTAFNDPTVHDEIRTVVKGNFQGNRLGSIIFQILVQEFSVLPPAAWLTDVDAIVLTRLKAIDGDIAWLQRDDTSALGEIARQLRDLVDRELLVASEAEPVAYRLRFPHHLGVLRQADADLVVREVRKEIEALRATEGGSADSTKQVRSLVPVTALRDLREMVLRRDPELPVRFAVLGAMWIEAAADPAGGIPDRLGIPRAKTLSASSPELVKRVNDEPFAVTGATPATAEDLLARRTKAFAPAVLIGGADLLRWALAHEKKRKDLIEICSLGRLPRATLAWWFERVRALEFSDADAIERIAARTSGVGILVRHMEAVILSDTSSGGFNVSTAQLEAALAEYDSTIDEVARLLVKGIPAFRLQPREIEILRMVATVGPTPSLREYLMEGWDLLYRDQLDVKPLDETDDVALATLLRLGLLHAAPDKPVGLPFERVAPFEPGEPMLRVIDAIRTHL